MVLPEDIYQISCSVGHALKDVYVGESEADVLQRIIQTEVLKQHWERWMGRVAANEQIM